MTLLHHSEQDDPTAKAAIRSFVDNVPPLPIIVAHVLELTHHDDMSVLALAHAVEADTVLTSRLLRIANSAYYALPEHVYTVRDAIQYIGFEGVRSLVLATTAVSGLWVDDETFDRHKFWRHSLRCALFAKKIAEHVPLGKPDILFTMGVLHDIGRASLMQNDAQSYRTILEVMKSDHLPLWKAEKQVLGVHHGEVGGMLAEGWHLPQEFAGVIMFHHEPQEAGPNELPARIITLADSMAHAAAPQDRQGMITPPLVHSLWDPLGMDEKIVRSIFEDREYIEHHTRSLYETALFS